MPDVNAIFEALDKEFPNGTGAEDFRTSVFPEITEEEAPEIQEQEQETESEQVVEEQEETHEPEQESAPAKDKQVEGLIRQRKTIEEQQRQILEKDTKLAFFEDLARKNGMSLEELMRGFQEKSLQEEAKKQGVPVEVVKQQQRQQIEIEQLKQFNAMQTQQMQGVQFNNAFSSFLKEIPMNQDEIRGFFQQVSEKGINLMQNPSVEGIKIAYYSLNPSALEQRARQNVLQDMKTKQKKAPLSGGTLSGNSGNVSSEDAWMQDFFKDTPYAEKMKSKK